MGGRDITSRELVRATNIPHGATSTIVVPTAGSIPYNRTNGQIGVGRVRGDDQAYRQSRINKHKSIYSTYDNKCPKHK